MNDEYYKDEPVYKIRPTNVKAKLKPWSKQLFIAVESKAVRLVKQYGIKDSKPDETFIKAVQKAAAAKGMTVGIQR